MNSEERAVRQVHASWIDAVNAGDLEYLLSQMAGDVVFLNVGQPPVGRDAFSSGFVAAHQQNLIRCGSEVEQITIVGEVAYTCCRDTLSVIPRAGGAAIALAGHRLTIYRKQTDGRWLLACDANTLAEVAR